MEDLVPLLIFIVIAAVNFLKYVSEKSGKRPPAGPDRKPVEQEPTTLEDFFEEIERKFAPQPRELPEWPETIERPDYVREMEVYEATRTPVAPQVEIEEIVPEPTERKPVPLRPALIREEMPPPENLGKVATFKIPAQGEIFSGLNHMRISMPPLLRSAGGRTRFDLNTRSQLKRALIAGMVFGQPRAYDCSFDTTLAK